jgi:hypothetical protein
VEQIVDRVMKGMLKTTEERAQGVVSGGRPAGRQHSRHTSSRRVSWPTAILAWLKTTEGCAQKLARGQIASNPCWQLVQHLGCRSQQELPANMLP